MRRIGHRCGTFRRRWQPAWWLGHVRTSIHGHRAWPAQSVSAASECIRRPRHRTGRYAADPSPCAGARENVPRLGVLHEELQQEQRCPARVLDKPVVVCRSSTNKLEQNVDQQLSWKKATEWADRNSDRSSNCGLARRLFRDHVCQDGSSCPSDHEAH